MVLASPVLLVLLPLISLQAVAEICRGTHCYGAEPGDPRPCIGAHCPGSRSSRPLRQFNPAMQGKAAHIVASQHHVYSGSQRDRVAAEAYPAVQPLRGRHADSSGGTRGRALEVLPARCTDGDCGALVKPFQPNNDTRDCRGIECRLPLRIRPKPRAKSCVGEGCLTASEESVSSSSSSSQLPPVHLSDRAAQFLGDFPELGYPSPELGGAPLGVQLTCDIKPGLLSSSLSHKHLTVVFLLLYTVKLRTVTHV